jgi:DnaJ family protein C protein 17
MAKDPEKDPYDVLGVSFEATDAQIAKAYRKLALQLHPDKQHGKSEAKQAEISKRFHDIKEARSFLLDVEHAEGRRKYDSKRQSIRLRQQQEAIREKSMSERRKRMRDELKQKEDVARGSASPATSSDQLYSSTGDKSHSQTHSHNRSRREDDKVLNELRKEGKRKREEMDAKQMDEELLKETHRAAERTIREQQQKQRVEQRQVRLKWDRKRVSKSNTFLMGEHPSEDSLAQLVSKFGTVERVELLGKKGNQALVTFADRASCKPCVDAYATSKDMRAKFVNERQGDDDDDENGYGDSGIAMKKTNEHNHETLAQRRQRQALERDELLRQMERDEIGEGRGHAAETNDPRTTTNKTTRKFAISLFPLQLPHSDDENKGLSSIEILEVFEDKVLKGILSTEDYGSLKCKVVT